MSLTGPTISRHPITPIHVQGRSDIRGIVLAPMLLSAPVAALVGASKAQAACGEAGALDGKAVAKQLSRLPNGCPFGIRPEA